MGLADWQLVRLHESPNVAVAASRCRFRGDLRSHCSNGGAHGSPHDLISKALPLTGAFVLIAGLTPALIWRRSLAALGVSLLTFGALIVLLGLNVSVLGFVAIPRDSAYLRFFTCFRPSLIDGRVLSREDLGVGAC